MAPERILAAIACAALVALGTPARADDQYLPGEFLRLDLSKVVLSPKRLGPPAEFAPVAVEARSDASHVVATPRAGARRSAQTTRITQRTHAPRTSAPTKLASRSGHPLDAQAMDRSIQTWPCRTGGICNWKR
ncbi:MAG: hypothetical protein U1E61_02305 [Bradyrhizobium sp.]